MKNSLSFINKIAFFCLICIILGGLNAQFVSSAKPAQFSVGDEGLDIKLPQVEYLRQNRDVRYNFHVFNKSNGLPLDETNVNCLIHLYNQTGYHIFIENITTTEHVWDFEGDIAGGNFSTLGLYSFIVQCNNSLYGGFISSSVEVTYNGNAPPSDFVTVFFILVFILILALAIFALINLIQHFITQDVDLKDLACMYILFFAMFSMKYFNMEYMGSSIIDGFSDIFVSAGVWVYIFVPTTLFIFSYVKRALREGLG